MKIRSLFLTALAATAFVSCSNEDELQGGNNATGEDNGQAYIALSLSMPKSLGTRADLPVPGSIAGSEEESNVSKAVALLFDGNAATSKVVNYLDLAWTGGTPTLAGKASDAFKVDTKAKYILVVVNPTTSIKTNFRVGTTLANIQSAISLDDSKIAELSIDDNFVMNNIALVDCSAKIKKYPTDGNTDVALQDAAKVDPIKVTVDRAVAKVTLQQATADKFKTADGATVTIEDWRLNVTNYKMFLMPTVGTTASGASYTTDPNYSNNSAFKADYFTEFKVDNAFVSFATKKDLYCTENTMQADDQKYAYTTQAVLKVKYLPKDITGSWLRFEGKAYTFADLQAAYTDAAVGSALKTAGDAFAVALLGTDKTFTDVTAGDLKVETSEKVKDSGIDYFHEGICYYKIMIRHDQNNDVLMSLGRYGVVRNNWYTLTVNSIMEPGLSYPADPVKVTGDDIPVLDMTDDDVRNFLSVTITVNNWTTWSQNIEL